VCTTGLVGAKEGFWRESTVSDVFLKCREGVCLQEAVVGLLSQPSDTNAKNASTSRRLLGATASNATSPSNCVEGNTGPLCGLCVPGYALQSGQCLPCDPNDAFDTWSAGSKAALLVLCVITGLVIVAFALLQPLVPALERASVAFMASLSAAWRRIFDCCCCCFTQRSKAEGPSESGKVADVQLIEKDIPARFDALKGTSPGKASSVDGAAVAHAHAPQQRIELQEARQEAASHGINSAIASGVGNAMAVGMELDEDEMGEGAAEVMLQGFDGLEELVEQLQRVAKILVNFYQVSFCDGRRRRAGALRRRAGARRQRRAGARRRRAGARRRRAGACVGNGATAASHSNPHRLFPHSSSRWTFHGPPPLPSS